MVYTKEQSKEKRIYSKWSKEVKKAMIDKDLTMQDIADKFNWTSRYVSAVINGRVYYEEPVIKISLYLGIKVPAETSATLSKKVIIEAHLGRREEEVEI